MQVILLVILKTIDLSKRTNNIYFDNIIKKFSSCFNSLEIKITKQHFRLSIKRKKYKPNSVDLYLLIY